MKKILVPIDYSECSKNGFLYARRLASTLGFSLKVIHTYSGILATYQPIVLQPGMTHQEIENKRLQEFVTAIPKNIGKENTAEVLTKIKIETEAIDAASIATNIINLTDDEDIAMVVMGANGAGNNFEKLLGSVASAVAQKAHCPVLLVPKDVVFQEFKNILYASNYESADENMVQQVIDMGNIFRANMHFVHIEEQDNYEAIEDTIFNKLFEKGDPAFSFNIVNIKNRSVIGGLQQYADENEIDLMVLVNRQRNYLENLFQMSLTKKMARSTKLPLLVFHLMND